MSWYKNLTALDVDSTWLLCSSLRSARIIAMRGGGGTSASGGIWSLTFTKVNWILLQTVCTRFHHRVSIKGPGRLVWPELQIFKYASYTQIIKLKFGCNSLSESLHTVCTISRLKWQCNVHTLDLYRLFTKFVLLASLSSDTCITARSSHSGHQEDSLHSTRVFSVFIIPSVNGQRLQGRVKGQGYGGV